MGRQKRDTKQTDLFNLQEYLATAPCVPAIRNAVASWRETNYNGATQTTKELLNYWFKPTTSYITDNNFHFTRHKEKQLRP